MSPLRAFIVNAATTPLEQFAHYIPSLLLFLPADILALQLQGPLKPAQQLNC